MGLFRRRSQEHLAELDAYRTARKLLEEDVVALGEQLETLTGATQSEPLDTYARLDLEQAVRRFETGRIALAEAGNDEALAAVDVTLAESRFHLACAIARQDGVDLPRLRVPCYFNPQHGPAVKEMMWSPPIGDEREVGACRRDLERLEANHEPDHRLVRVGDRYVKWYEAGPAAGLIPEPGRTAGTRHRQPDRRIAEAHITVGNNPATGGRFGGNPGG